MATAELQCELCYYAEGDYSETATEFRGRQAPQPVPEDELRAHADPQRQALGA
jgi:hypothetical protein